MSTRRGALQRTLVGALCGSILYGCSGIGTSKFYDDQLGYSRALGDGEKSSTLLNVVRIRYGDSPTFLQTTQVISGYQLQRTVTGGFEAFPAANPSTFLMGSAAAQMQESPTFTFQPLSGEQFAQSFVRPLSSSDLLPLAMSGLPIDVLFRLGVQSVNSYSNAVALAQTNAAGTPEFFQILYDLRLLQVAGLLNVRVTHTHMTEGAEDAAAAAAGHALAPASPPVPAPAPAVSSSAHPAGSSAPLAASAAPPAPAPPPAPVVPVVSAVPPAQSNGFHGGPGLPPFVYLNFTESTDPQLTAIAIEVKRLMGISPHATEAEVVYGRTPGPGQVAMITRSVLGVMSQLAIQIEVPAEDVALHKTLPTVGNVGLEHRPVVIIQCGHARPSNAFTSVKYGEHIFWISDDDFDSKLAFTVLQVLLALARSGTTPGALVSVPAH